MEPIVEYVGNPNGQSFYARRYDINNECISPGWHIHPEYELVLVKNGSGKVHVGSHFSSYKNGLLILLGPNIPHMPFDNAENIKNIEIVVQFRETLPRDNIARFPELSVITELCKRCHSGLLFGDEIRERLTDSLIQLCELPYALQLCKFLEIMLELGETEDYQDLNVRGIQLKQGENDYNRINKVYDFVAENYRNEIRTEIVAEKLGLTTNSFCRFFKKVTKKSFIQFVNEFRINKAIEMINLDYRSISETMYDSGFNDPSFFNRQFKRLKGLSPSEYRDKKWKRSAA